MEWMKWNGPLGANIHTWEKIIKNMLFLQMSLEKVNDGFEGDQKTLVKERDVSLEEGKGGDDDHQVSMMMLVVVVRD